MDRQIDHSHLSFSVTLALDGFVSARKFDYEIWDTHLEFALLE